MGDTVVFEDEVSPAIDAAFARGLDVTALHNHFFFEHPKVYFMHLGGMGAPARLSEGVKAVWDAILGRPATVQDPAFYFTHFWGKGEAAGLARNLRVVLETQAKARTTRTDG